MSEWFFLRDGRKPPFAWCANEIIDEYMPDINLHGAFVVYMILARHADPRGNGRMELEDLYTKASVSINTARSALRLLARYQLIKRHDGRGFRYTLLPIPESREERRAIIAAARGDPNEDDPPELQLTLPLSSRDQPLIPCHKQGSTIDPMGSIRDQPLIPQGSTIDPKSKNRDQPLIPKNGMGSTIDPCEAKNVFTSLNERTHHHQPWNHGTMDLRALPANGENGGDEETGDAPPMARRPPRVPPGERPIELGPHEMAEQKLGRQITRAEAQQIDTLIRKNDRPKGAYKGGYGAFWVEQAIEEADLAEPIAGKVTWLSYVGNILRRWRCETTDQVTAYGSDKPMVERPPRRAPEPQQPPAPAPRPPAPTRPEPEPQQLQQPEPSAPIAIDGELGQLDQVEEDIPPPTAEDILGELRMKCPFQRQLIDQLALSGLEGSLIISYSSRQQEDEVQRLLPLIRSLYINRGYQPPRLVPRQQRRP